MLLVTALVATAPAQTLAQQETSIAYLRKRSCIDSSGGAPVVVAPTCYADADCPAPATCQHRSVLEDPADLYPELELRPEPTTPGTGEGVLRYVPLCEDGSGDHEYSVSGGRLGTPPTCAPQDFVRCGDGTRPFYRIAPGTSNDWLVHAGPGGHASSPHSDEMPIWVYANQEDTAAAYAASVDPPIRGAFTGIFRTDPANPFDDWNRVVLYKCTADTWLGNTEVTLRLDTVEEMQAGTCEDADHSGEPTCLDNQTRAGACACREVAPPSGANHEYAVYYHGKRIVRSVLADLLRGAVARTVYPLVDDGTGHALVQPGDVRLSPPTAASEVAFHCHSNGCVGLQGGHIDDLRTMVRAAVGPADVSVLFNSALPPSYEVEWAVSEWDGADADGNGRADADAIIDDTRSTFDHVVDTVSTTAEPMGVDAWAPGGPINVMKDDWYAPRPGYAPPVDASCLAHHCPNTADWANDPACTPCNSAVHVLFNHLETPLVYNAAQTDVQFTLLARQCLDPAGGQVVGCDFRGDFSGVNLVDSHYRQAVRKQMADLYRYAATDRCEASSGAGPYDRVLLLGPDWSNHGSLLEDPVAAYTLDLDGPVPETDLATAAWWWLEHTSSTSRPRKAICLEERSAGENAADFGGTIPGCR